MKLKLNGHDINFANALPLTLGDLEAIQKLELISETGEVNVSGPAKLIDLLHYLAGKAHEGVTREDICTIPISKIGQLGDWARKALVEDPKPNRPS